MYVLENIMFPAYKSLILIKVDRIPLDILYLTVD